MPTSADPTLITPPATRGRAAPTIGIYGSAGRMGRAIIELLRDEGAAPAGGADAGDDPAQLARAADVLVDFSTPSAVEAHLAAARAAGTPMLVGTTGLSRAHHVMIDDAARDIAVLQTGNTSLGVTLLSILVRDAAARLGAEWDVEIVEFHHRHKVDAPSGTALLLGEAVAAGRDTSLGEVRVDSRAGLVGARTEGTIGFASLRGGSVVGDHQVIFAGDGERLELGHRGDGRVIFARGAIRAARWLAGQPAGRYTMTQVLGF
ncbi:4-hydroxy-tetrahydrodipicolinate reductase [uncultured Sphingomonas sp.]|uniref:4-hydroxy-tetrahydrodipicolinate reductase n=1 Tax=uncultured Sphingomonas sp. TaxID=158754 RepID=UPI0035CC8F9A